MSFRLLVLAGCLGVGACEPRILDGFDEAASRTAFERWADACPSHYAEVATDIPRLAGIHGRPVSGRSAGAEAETGTYDRRARQGELEALDCMVLHDRAVSAGRPDALAEREFLVRSLYRRWRLHDIGYEELDEEASRFPRETLRRLIEVEHSLSPALPDLKRNACRDISRADPAHEIIRLGTGDDDPACPQGG